MKNRVLFVSNCFGEDRSAALIARELKRLFEEKKISKKIQGASLISEGGDYSSRGIELLFSSYVPPSGGFPTRSLKGLLSDLFHTPVLFKFINQIKKYRDEIELCIAVGDVSLLFLTRRALKNCPIVFLAPAKSDYIEPHYKIEEWYIRKNTDYLLTHDAFTAENLMKKGITALFLGNPMMDELENKSLQLKIDKNKPVIGILPGSREEAYDNFMKILEVVDILSSNKKLPFLAAIPGTLDDKIIADKASAQGWVLKEKDKHSFLKKGAAEVILCRGLFTEVLNRSDLIIGLAGTANEQAAGMGKPIIGFQGSGPQTTSRRMAEQERLLGGALKIIKNFPQDAVNEILYLLDHPEEMKKRGDSGKEHMGGPGGAQRIAEFIIQKYYEG